MKKVLLVFILSAIFTAFYLHQKQTQNEIVIGIVLPLEHRAMNEIVEGFSSVIKESLHQKYVIKVENAQNDNNLQRSILQKMKDAQYNLIIPIGTTPTQMASAMIHQTPIIGLAADFYEKDRQKLNPCHITIVHDEIPAQTVLEFIHKTYPHITKLSLVHSSSEKVLPEVQETIAEGKKLGIDVSHFMVSTLPELISVSQALPKETQGVFVLKDSLVVSGIATLSKEAVSRKIPLITSDQGSAESGATLALGVRERQIGVEGALLALKVLQGAEPCQLPMTDMKHLSVFLNTKTLSAQNLTKEPIEKAARELNYQIEYIQ